MTMYKYCMLLSKSFKSGSNLRFQFAPFEFNDASVLVSIQFFLKAVVVFGGSFGTLHLHTCMMFGNTTRSKMAYAYAMRVIYCLLPINYRVKFCQSSQRWTFRKEFLDFDVLPNLLWLTLYYINEGGKHDYIHELITIISPLTTSILHNTTLNFFL